jgi:hypothetical protein
VDREALAAQAKRALMDQASLLDSGGPTRAEDYVDGNFTVSAYCGMLPSGESRSGHVAHERIWYANGFSVFNITHSYHRKRGTEVLQFAHNSSQRCTTYQDGVNQVYTDARGPDGSNVRYDMLPPVEFTTPVGVDDSFGVCVIETYPSGLNRVVCTAYLARKNVVSIVVVLAGSIESDIRNKLLAIIPKAGTALARV